MSKEIKIGIYKITNILNNKMYIGSSKDIYKRWKEHIRGLNKGNHHSIKLQRAWNKYGEDSFEFQILEECEEDKRLYLEQYYIDKYKVYYEGYNCKEKTREMYTEIDYEREKEYSTYSNIFFNYSKCGLLDFSDKNTIKRVENFKYKNNEHIWYFDILCFVKYTFDGYNYTYIRNNQNYDKNYFIDFNISEGELYFEVIIKEYNIGLKFEYFINDRTILLIRCNELKKQRNIFDRDNNYDNCIAKYLLGKLYYSEKLISHEGETYIYYEENTYLYFKKFTKSINPSHLDIIYEDYFKCNEEFLNNIYDFLKENKISLSHRSFG